MEFLIKIKEKWQTVLVITLVVTAVIFSISAFLKPQYESEVSILVIQKQPSDKVDAFSAAKSAEYLSDILAKVAYSESFIQNVLDSPYNVQIDFPLEDQERKKYWKKMVDVDQVNNTGIIKVTVYDQSRVNAENLADSIAWAYIIRGHQYHGGGDRVEIEKIDGPITPEGPTKPNLGLNTLLGFIVGLIGSATVIYFFEEFDLKIFKKKDNADGKQVNYHEKKDDLSLNGIMKFREKHGEYASFDDYVFDKERNSVEEEAINEEVIVDENFSDKINEIEIEKEDAIVEIEKKENKEEKKIVEIHEPNSFDGELSFEEVLVGSKKKENISENAVTSLGTPGNLPTFEGDVNSLVSGNVVAEAEEKNTQAIDKSEEKEYIRESTEDEIKEKLNKLLKGEM